MSGPVGIDLSQGAAALAVLAIRGSDAARFLQGQVSADVDKLSQGASTLAGFHNPQGRVIALLAITRTTTEEFLAVLPRDLAATVALRLRKFVLRAKVRIDDISATMRVCGASANVLEDMASIAWGDRRLLLVPEDHEIHDEISPLSAATIDAWNRQDVRQGLPQVYAATSETFVAQMLNLDLLGAIAFDKGCYTGQEVIARAHYRGRVKRRLQRWSNPSGTLLEPGQTAHAPDGRPLVVVRTAPAGAGAQELLAVGAFAPAASGESPLEPGVALNGPLPLPYALPD